MVNKDYTTGVHEHLSPYIKEGYVVDESRFTQIRAWNFLLIQLHDAKLSLELAKQSEKYEEKGSIPEIVLQQSLFRNSIINYAKCFSSVGKGRISLDKKSVYKGNPELLSTHQEVMNIRNKFSAHNDDAGIDIAHTLTREEGNRFILKHLYSIANPIGDYEQYMRLYEYCETHVIKSLNRALDNISRSPSKNQ